MNVVTGVWGNGHGSVTPALMLVWSTFPKAKSWELELLLFFFSLSSLAALRWLQCDWYLLSHTQGTCKNKGLFACIKEDVLKASQSSRAYRTQMKISRKQYSNFSSNIWKFQIYCIGCIDHCQLKAMGILSLASGDFGLDSYIMKHVPSSFIF